MHPDSPAPPRTARLSALFWLGMQLAVLWTIARGFQIENANFLRMLQLAFAAIIVRALLPDRLHFPFFATVSIVGLMWLLGPVPGAWILALGLLLIATAHLPISFALRVGLALAAAVALAWFRAGRAEAPWPAMIWPIFGAMFMFRYIVYLYDLRHRAASFGPWQALSYFFMLPNVCFPLFPVVDYKTFVRSWNGRWNGAEVQQGVDALFRGLTQLLIYRVIYQHLIADVTSLESASGAALYLVRPYLLYLKISGSFHVIVGILTCFGFALPRSNHNYYLASSFTDYWRRINIYWKDFLQKIIFNPAYFALNRRMPATPALVLATVIAFGATWALHSYQWFWIRGSFPIVWQDVVFWSFMGLVVLGNMILESRKGRRRSLKAPARTLRSDLRLAGATIATFLLICSAWAIWSVQGSGELQLMVEHLLRPSSRDLLNILGGLLLLGASSVFYARMEATKKDREGLSKWIHVLMFGRALARWRVVVLGGSLVGLAYGSLVIDYPPRLASLAEGLRNPLRLSGRDAQAMDRGYYEDLTDVARFNPELAELYAERPPDWERCWALQRTGAFPTHVLQPSRTVAFKGAEMSTNSHGMRDQEYTLEKGAGVYRIALHGASHTMGSGVEDDEVFEAVAEASLNAQLAMEVQILNFSVAGFGPLARLADLESRILDFEPDALVLVGINDLHWAAKEFLEGLRGEYELPWPELASFAEQWDLRPGMDPLVAEARLRPHRAELLRWVYQRVRQTCDARGIRCFLLGLPQPRTEAEETMQSLKQQLAIAAECGFVPLDILDAYGTRTDFSDLYLAKWDKHPNAAGHAILAKRFFAALKPHLEQRP